MWRSTVISVVLLGAAAMAVAGTRPQYGGTLRVETAGDVDAVARPLVFDTLTRVDESGRLQGRLAVRWSGDNNGQRWQFWLRAGVVFHDGRALTAEDVVQALGADCGGSCPWRTLRAVGASVVMTTDAPMPTMPEELARQLYIVAKKNDAGEMDGTGAFQVSSHGHDVVTLAAVNDAWAGRPFVDAMEIDGHRTVRAQWLDMSVGRADVVDVPAEQMRAAQQAHMSVIASRPTDLLVLTVRGGALTTVEQRAAVAAAVDRGALATVIYQRQGEASASLLPNALTGYSFLFATGRDVAKAVQLLGGQHPAVTVAAENGEAAMQLAAERLVLNLRDAGFNAQVRPAMTPADLVLRRAHMESGDARAGLHEMLRFFGKDAEDGGGDPASLYRVEKGLLDTHSVVPLLWLPRAYAVSGRVRGLRLTADGGLMLADAAIKVEQP